MNNPAIVPKQHGRWFAAAYGLILLSFFLRVFQLDNIAVEKAEMTNIVWFIRDGWLSVLTNNKALNNHPLNSVLGYVTSSLGHESLFSLRWHSVVIGVISVAVAMRLAQQWFGKRDALVAGLLITLSAYHVTISQVARGYVGLIGFTLLGFYLADRAGQTGRKRYWLGFVLVSALNVYSHLYGVIAVATITLIVLGLQLWPIVLARSSTPPGRFLKAAVVGVTPLLVSVAISYLISFGLYLPMLPDTVAVAGQDNIFRESDLRHLSEYTVLERFSQPVLETIRPYSLAEDATRLRLDDPTFHYGPVDHVAVLAEGRLGFYLVLGSVLMGLVFSWRKFPQVTLILAAWFILPFIMQMAGGVILPGAYFRGRFLAFVYPPFLFLMARGWPGLADWLAGQLGPRPPLRFAAAALAWLGLACLVGLNLAWLGTFYAAAANEHWNTVARHISSRLQPADVIVCGQRPKTACNFDLSTRTRREVKEFANLVAFENVQANRAQIEQPGRVWVVMPHVLPWQVAGLKDNVEPDHYWLAGPPAYDQVAWLLVDSQPTLAGNLLAAMRLGVELSLDSAEKFRNYIGLAQIYLARQQLAAAEEAFAAAAALLPEDEGSLERFELVADQLEYARQAAGAIAALPATAVRVDLNFAGKARLLAYEVDRQIVSPGQTMQVKLYWQPLARIDEALVSYAHLTDLKATMIDRAEGIPAKGQSPTTTWEPGQLVIDSYPLTVDAAIQPPLALKLEAGLFDPQNYQFIKAIDETGQPAASVIKKVKVLAATRPSPQPGHVLEADFAGLISLAGYDLITEPPGIVFYWRAEAELEENYAVFVHLLDAEGQLAGQMDGEPFQGNYPTSWWSPGELIVDQRTGPALDAGNYQMRVGWYRYADGARLPLADGSGDSVTLNIVNVP